MATIATEKQIERKIEVYPAAELVSSINRMLKETIPIKIALVSSESGDVAFIATLSDLGITRQTFSHPFYHSHLFADLIGELLVRQNMNTFCDRVMSNSKYDALVKAYNHTGMGLRLVKNDELMFQFHMSLIFKLYNEQINQIITEELSKISILSGAKKVKREEEKPSITSFSNDANNLRLIVSNHTSVRHCFENAIKTILNFYNIKNKDIFITHNMFSMEIEITDAKNEKSL